MCDYATDTAEEAPGVNCLRHFRHSFAVISTFRFCVLFFRLLAAILSETHPDALLSQLIALQDMSESHRLSKVWDGCVALI